MTPITYLGPLDSTFSSDAWKKLSEHFNVPKSPESKYTPVFLNQDILPMVIKHGGYGVIAIRTEYQGPVVESIKSFSLRDYFSAEDCPFHIIGAIRMKINICLMARPCLRLEDIKGVLGHNAAIAAYTFDLSKPKLQTIEFGTNGLAAENVSKLDMYAHHAALGPKTAAEKFGLTILKEHIGSPNATTTFALIGPKSHHVIPKKDNQMIITFSLPDSPGSLVDALMPFKKALINIWHVQTEHIAYGMFTFTISIVCSQDELQNLEKAVAELKHIAIQCLVFGPFPVISVG